MSLKVTTVDMPIRSFVEKSDVTLNEGDLVCLHTDGTVKLATAGNVLGIMSTRLYVGMKTVAIIIFGRTARVVQDSAIPVGSYVQQKASALNKVEAAAGGTLVGMKIQPATGGAQGDIIEIVVGGIAGVAGATLTAQTGVLHGNADGAIGALTFSSTPTQAEVNALRDACETLADDVRSLRAKVIAAGVPLTLA